MWDAGLIAALVIVFLIAIAAVVVAAVGFSGTDALPTAKINVGNEHNVSKAVFMSGGATMDQNGVVTLNTNVPAQNIVATSLTASGPVQAQKFTLTNGAGNTVNLIAPPSVFANYQVKLPTSAGTAGQVLTTDGAAGDLSWTTPSALHVDLSTAEYVQTTQGTNVSVAAGAAISYLVDNPTGLVNTIGITTAVGPTQGTAFMLPVGTFIIDWENSNAAAASTAVYQGSTNLLMSILGNSTAGSTTVTSWIHGRHTVISTVGNQWVMISPAVGTLVIPAAGNSSLFVARVGFLQTA
jgi:hypothetical protein